MWRAHPWQDSPVNVNFGATSHEQSMSLPKLPMCDATRAGKVCRALGEPDSAGKGFGQVWGTPALHPHSWEGMGAMELPEWEWALPLQLAHGYAGRCLHNSPNRALRRLWAQQLYKWQWTERQPDTQHWVIPRISHTVQWCPVTTQGTGCSSGHQSQPSKATPQERGWGGSWHCMGAVNQTPEYTL